MKMVDGDSEKYPGCSGPGIPRALTVRFIDGLNTRTIFTILLCDY